MILKTIRDIINILSPTPINFIKRTANNVPQYVPPGHYYSPIPCIEEIKTKEASIFGNLSNNITAINLNKTNQMDLLYKFKQYYDEIPFSETKTNGFRYYYDNPSYSYSDAIFLYCMIRHIKPRRIIEIGSGHSTCVTLDTNELYFNNSIDTTFIEPYPELLLSLLKSGDEARIKVIQQCLQDVDISEFDILERNDILFIDSTHVSKVNSDVNRIFFEILPRLARGVFIHFHDIFFPFEYPKDWIYEGRAWTEAYMLRAFLQYNDAFRIILMNTYLELFHKEFFEKEMPLCLKNTGGSIWIQKA